MNKGNQVAQTPAEQSLQQMASQRMNDYQTRWLPLQQKLADTVTKMGQPGSPELRQAQGRAVGDTMAAEREQENQIENAPDGKGDRGAIMGVVGAGERRTAAAGTELNSAQAMIDKAYTEGLSSLMQTGRGVAQGAVTSGSQAAGISAQEAWGNAYNSATSRARMAGAIGSGLGMAAGYAMNPGTPNPGNGLVASGQSNIGAVAPEIAAFQPSAVNTNFAPQVAAIQPPL